MRARRIRPEELRGKIIDIHSHLGVSLKAYIREEYPYAQTAEGLYYRQRANGIDVNVVFPFSPDLFFEPAGLAEGRLTPAAAPLSRVPYGTENRLLMREIYSYCPELSHRFLPFVSVDPGRRVADQLRAIEALEAEYPVYGIKISPVSCQSPVKALLGEARVFLDYARERDIPLLLHTTVHPQETYSQGADAMEVAAANPAVRFCLAHGIGCHRRLLEAADAADNVWVDTSALKIQVQLAREESPIMAPPGERFEADYSDHLKVMRALAERFPDTVIWGSDSPAYAYICRRAQADGVFYEFRLKATCEDEKAALDSLPADARARVANRNSLRFLFGAAPHAP